MGGGLLWQKEYFFHVKGSINPVRFVLVCSIYTVPHECDNTEYPPAVFSLIDTEESPEQGFLLAGL